MQTEVINSNETENKILLTARKLFSKYGFEGTSIRDIANDCQVNVAAVNYHFKNKENLYWAVIDASFEESEKICAEIARNSNDLESFALSVYDHFRKNTDLIRNTMKLMLSERMCPPEDSLFYKRLEQGAFGPPGGQYFAKLLVNEIPYKIRKESVMWGVKSIFGTVVHWSTMCATSHFEAMSEKQPLLSPKQIRIDVQRMVRATVEYMKSHPEIFK